MTKFEFLGRLRDALAGEIPESAIEENIRFYSRYIDDELQKGRSETEVFQELGDARLIAKTIAETWQSEDTSFQEDYQSNQQTYHSYDSYQTYEENNNRTSGSYANINGRRFSLDKWYLKIIPIAIVLLIVFFFGWVLFGMLKLTFNVLTSPVFWGVVLLIMVFSFFSRRR